MKPPIVTVFGSSQPAPGSPAYQTAYDLGLAIGRAGWTLCNGGYGGTMEATARGAAEAGGHTIGVTCSIFGRGSANRFIKQEIPTFYLLTRLDTLVRLGQAYVVLPGGTGTLLELALVWELLNKRLLRRNAPIILMGNTWQPVVEVIRREQPETMDLQVAANAELAAEALRAHFATDAPEPAAG
ncbi:MAG: LOG family protein [Phycisphaerae bacterium]